MIAVQDEFDLIQARGKVHRQMFDSLRVSFSDTEYWAKKYFQEYLDDLSESKDPAIDASVRLGTHSIIKDELESLLNFVKDEKLEKYLSELQHQKITQDYYASVATCKALNLCRDHFDKITTFTINCRYLNKGKDRFEEIIHIELLKNDLQIREYIFRHNTLESIVRVKDPDSYSTNEFFSATSSTVNKMGLYEFNGHYISLEEIYQFYHRVLESLTMIKRMKKFPSDFNNMFIKLRGLGIYSTNNEITVEVDKIKFLSWCSFYGESLAHAYNFNEKRYWVGDADDAEFFNEQKSVDFLKKYSQIYPFTYLIAANTNNGSNILDILIYPEELVKVERYHYSRIDYDSIHETTFICESFGPKGNIIESAFSCGPEDQKNHENQIEEKIFQSDSFNIDFDEFKGCDLYLKDDYEKLKLNPDFHKIS